MGRKDLNHFNISLDEENFKTLVSGGIVKIKTPVADIQIALKDIGFDRMLVAVGDAIDRRR